MDLHKILRELHAERLRIKKIIDTLEELYVRGAKTPPKKRGRKSMDAKARKEVSQRMKRYWAARKEESGDDREDSPAETAKASNSANK